MEVWAGVGIIWWEGQEGRQAHWPFWIWEIFLFLTPQTLPYHTYRQDPQMICGSHLWRTRFFHPYHEKFHRHKKTICPCQSRQILWRMCTIYCTYPQKNISSRQSCQVLLVHTKNICSRNSCQVMAYYLYYHLSRERWILSPHHHHHHHSAMHRGKIICIIQNPLWKLGSILWSFWQKTPSTKATTYL